MNNDLISRSELLGKFTAMLTFSSDRVVLIENVIEQIQNAPTVEERPQYFPPCEDCRTKMDEIRSAYDKLQGAK